MSATSVNITMYNEDMFVGCETDGIDMDATRERYEELVTERIKEAYPAPTTVTIDFRNGVGYTRIDVETDMTGPVGEPASEEQDIEDILYAIWERGDFWVEVGAKAARA